MARMREGSSRELIVLDADELKPLGSCRPANGEFLQFAFFLVTRIVHVAPSSGSCRVIGEEWDPCEANTAEWLPGGGSEKEQARPRHGGAIPPTSLLFFLNLRSLLLCLLRLALLRRVRDSTRVHATQGQATRRWHRRYHSSTLRPLPCELRTLIPLLTTPRQATVLPLRMLVHLS